MSDVKVYTVNGAVPGSSSSIPDWLTKTRTSKVKGKRALREHVEGQIELIQGFEFPEASNKIKTTRDGHHAIATGTYKPQMRVWDLDELTLKFERHGDAENVDFIILSDDWTKTIHLQNDRTVELHTQSGFHYRTRIPRFGRSIAYHYPSCDALVSASGNEIYRLNLEQGQFMNPLVLNAPEDEPILGINCIDINPAHQLLAFGIDGHASVHFWDFRSRSVVGVLNLPKGRIARSTGRAKVTLPGVDDQSSSDALAVTAIAARSDGLSYAIGTSTGHTLLYDIRSPRPFAFKDQGYGLPLKRVAWLDGGSRMAGDGMVLSADKKVVKIWDRNTPSSNFVSITPATDLNDIHHIPGSGLLLTANEGIKMASYYIPQLGPAPRWASFLENITEEMEGQSVRNVYEDFKFIEKNELRTLGLDHLIGTPALKPYMHGYFVSLKLYDTARVIANPFAYAEHREKLVKERLEKLADTRIRTRKNGAAASVKVNKALAERIARDAEREQRREETKRARKAKKATKEGETDVADDAMSVDEEVVGEEQLTLLNDPRFKDLFENPDFAVNETSREYALLNPSSFAMKNANSSRRKTAVEDEDDESDKMSSDGLGSSGNESSEDGSESEDSSDAGELNKHDPRSRPGQQNARLQQAYSRAREANRQSNKVHFVPLVAQANAPTGKTNDKDAPFGQRLVSRQQSKSSAEPTSTVRLSADGGMEMTFIPSGTGDDDSPAVARKKKEVRKGVEVFGAGMERGVEEPKGGMSESERSGRKQRRKGMRSGSKNVFRQTSS
ncbi:WD40-repeat-containing domain protein [Boletus edulis]|nr:WD40-repeat-containing domain protein [Boletus edulis]